MNEKAEVLELPLKPLKDTKEVKLDRASSPDTAHATHKGKEPKDSEEGG